MKNIFKHNRTHKVKDQIKASEKLDTDKRHDRLKNSALMEYYMMGGY